MQTSATSVVSAAVIGGDLILGLGDGSIINCGRVQGPQGLKGDPGPIGATGRPGADGNTIHSVQGIPDTTLGKDGDFAINVIRWEIYGPRAGGVWGTATPLRNKAGDRSSKDPIFGMSSGSEGSGGGGTGVMQNTSSLPLSGSGKKAIVNAPGGDIVQPKPGCRNQANINNWVQAGLMALDAAVPVAVVDALPAAGNYEGELVFADGKLNIWAKGAWIEISSSGGKESEPFIEIDAFSVNAKYGDFRYNPVFNVNANAEYTWEYQINLDPTSNPDGWGDVADLDSATQNAIGWYNYETWMELRLNDVGQKVTYPKAEMRFRIWSKLNEKENELCSCPLPAWEDGSCDPVESYDDTWIKEQFAIRSKQTQFFDTAIRDNSVEIVKTKKALLDVNQELVSEKAARERGDNDLQAQIDELDVGTSYDDSDIREKLEEEKAFRVAGDEALSTRIGLTEDRIDKVDEKLEEEKALRIAGDEINKAAITSLETQTEDLRQADEVEKAARIAEDAKLAAGLVEEARVRADEDYKLLARINGLEIPEMPGEYDDSGLRELIEQESALRATGDAGLQRLIEDNTSLINDTNEALGAERSTRAEQVAKLHADVQQETAARERGDSDLQAQIDALEIPENFEETIERIDNDIQVTNQKVDFNAEETLKDQERQDEELENYKEEVKAEQEAQDARLEALEAIEPVNVLNDLDDVDLTGGVRAATVENEFTWLHYRQNNPDVGELGNNGDALLLHKQAWDGVDPTALIDRIEPGSIMAFRGVAGGAPVEEQGIVVSITSRGNTWEISYKEKLVFLTRLIEMGFNQDGVNVMAGYAGHDSSTGPGPVPPGDTVTAGTFLGYDKDKSLWVPQTLDVSGGGVTDLSDYYTKTQVDDKIDEKIDAIDLDVDLDDYYTKGEVDASQAAQDSRISALEAGGGGGGSVDLNNYYTKDETYDKRSVDNMVGIEATYRAQGDEALQDQIDDLKANGGSGKDLEPQVNTNTAGVLKNKQDIEALNASQDNQDRYIEQIDDRVTSGLDDRYTKGEVDEKFDALEDVDLSGLMVTDGRNKVNEVWRVVSEDDTKTFISTASGQLGLYNVKYPEKGVHGANMQYVDDQDAATLQSAKDYADGLGPDLSEYYTKTEVDQSQAAQDATANDLAEAVGAMGAKVDQNAVDIEAIEASSVENLNDLSDVSMSVRTLWKKRDVLGEQYGQEELSYSCQFKGYNKNSGRITDGNWGIDRGVLFLSKTVFFGSEADDLFANLLVGNKVYLQAAHTNVNLPKAPDRATIVSIDDLGNCFAYTFDDQLADLEAYMGRTWDIDSEATIQVALSEIVVVPEVPAEPEEPTRRTDIVLGYNSGSKLWTPHKADYLPLTGGTLTGDLKFDGKDLRAINGTSFRIFAQDSSGNTRTFLDAQNANHAGTDGADDGYRLKLYHVADPTSASHGANRRYVDRMVNRPPGLRFKYKSGSPVNSTVADGEFKFVKNDGKMRVSNKSLDVDFSQNTLVQDINITGHSYNFTIWKVLDDGKWQIMVQGYSTRADWHATDIYFYTSIAYQANTLVDGDEYYMTVGGIF